MPVQYGGGLRSLSAVRDALRAGAERVVLGTAALRDVDFLDDVLGAFRERIIVSVDTRGGNVSTSGWQETTTQPAESVIERLQQRGVRSFVYTNVDTRRHARGARPRRGQAHCRRRARALPVFGRHRRARGPRRPGESLRQVNLGGVIVGKALYEHRFTVARRTPRSRG